MNLQEMEKNSAKAVVLLKAMANERRLQILCMLHNQELSVGELAQTRVEPIGTVSTFSLASSRRTGGYEKRSTNGILHVKE